jgi:hypothetical protein
MDTSGATGGTVYILGELVGVVDGRVDASGQSGGGTILVGGDYQGQGGDTQRSSDLHWVNLNLIC